MPPGAVALKGHAVSWPIPIIERGSSPELRPSRAVNVMPSRAITPSMSAFSGVDVLQNRVSELEAGQERRIASLDK